MGWIGHLFNLWNQHVIMNGFQRTLGWFQQVKEVKEVMTNPHLAPRLGTNSNNFLFSFS